MRIVSAEACPRQAWDAFAAVHPRATAYHAWAWLEAVRRAYGFAPLPLTAMRDGQVAGILPLIRMGLPGLKGRLISLPYCDCCGPLAEDEHTETKLLDRALELARASNAAFVELRRVDQAAPDPAKVIMRLALPGDSRRLMAAFPSKLRSQVNKPLREGLTARTGGLELLGAFYGVFSRNMRDLGSPTHSQAWFRAVLEGYGERARTSVVFLPDGRPAAGAIWLVHARRACVPWASALREHNPRNPNMLLYWTMFSEAADAGLAEFDLGRSTPRGGTHRFKLQWGARETGLSWLRYDPATRLATPAMTAGGSQSLRKLAEACWRRLPTEAATAAGSVLRRYISR